MGNRLVFHREIPFPDICLKSNRPAIKRIEYEFSWRSLELLLVHIDKTVTVYLPLSDKWMAIREKRKMITSLLIAGGILIAGLSLAAITNTFRPSAILLYTSQVFLFLGIATFFSGVVYGYRHARFFRMSHYVDDDWFYLDGVGDDYLANLSEIPGGESSVVKAPPASWLETPPS
jgi:hypothetical protein